LAKEGLAYFSPPLCEAVHLSGTRKNQLAHSRLVLANRAGDGITPLATPHLGEALSAQDPHARLGLATDEREVGPRGRANTGAAEAAASPTVVQNGRKLIPRN
jgi:hypothetical protein